MLHHADCFVTECIPGRSGDLAMTASKVASQRFSNTTTILLEFSSYGSDLKFA